MRTLLVAIAAARFRLSLRPGRLGVVGASGHGGFLARVRKTARLNASGRRRLFHRPHAEGALAPLRARRLRRLGRSRRGTAVAHPPGPTRVAVEESRRAGWPTGSPARTASSTGASTRSAVIARNGSLRSEPLRMTTPGRTLRSGSTFGGARSMELK